MFILSSKEVQRLKIDSKSNCHHKNQFFPILDENKKTFLELFNPSTDK